MSKISAFHTNEVPAPHPEERLQLVLPLPVNDVAFADESAAPGNEAAAPHDAGATNSEVSELLERVAELLEAQGANPFRARAYRRAANELRRSGAAVAELVRQGGRDALLDLFGVGPGLASVQVLLDVDREYRREALAARLPTIAPKRCNPQGKAWLPVLHTQRGEWSFHVLYSNTALAHRLARTGDWVVIFYERDGDEDQVTVVTERVGELRGKRVVRGRERDCLAWYRSRPKRRDSGPRRGGLASAQS